MASKKKPLRPARASSTQHVKAKSTRRAAVKKANTIHSEIGDEYADEFSAFAELPQSLPDTGDRSGKKTQVIEFTWNSFDRHVQLLADAVRKFRPQAVIGLVHGGVFVGGALAKALKVEFFPLRVTSRSRDRKNDAAVLEDMPEAVRGLRILVVDDVAASGDSLEFATRLAKARGAKSVKTATLLSKPKKFAPDFTVLTSELFHVFPWDYDAEKMFEL
jgi:uncharacterized protein